MRYEFKIGWCPFCNQGWAEIVKDTSNDELLVMCSECDTVWNTPQDFKKNSPNPNYHFNGKITDPVIEEIIFKKWENFIDKT